MASMSAVRRRLDGFLDLKKELEMQTARLMRNRENVSDLRSPTFDSGRGTSDTGDAAMCRRVAKLQDLEKKVENLSQAVATEGAAIENAVSALRNVEQREVLILRYIDAMDWDSIVFEKYGDRTDYITRETEYRHSVYSLHARAVAALSCVFARVA